MRPSLSPTPQLPKSLAAIMGPPEDLASDETLLHRAANTVGTSSLMASRSGSLRSSRHLLNSHASSLTSESTRTTVFEGPRVTPRAESQRLLSRLSPQLQPLLSCPVYCVPEFLYIS
jgi:hypothetical protein